MPKKVLIITYYWPPAGGPGVQRWLKFAKYLPSFEIEPIVYVPENPNYPIIDEGLLEELPEEVTVIKRPIVEPYRWASMLSSKKTKQMSSGILEEKKTSWIGQLLIYIRGNYFIPDARKYWIKPSVSYLKKYINEHHIDTIITTGPPHSLHLIGLKLKKELGCHWIADFRDPWTSIGYHNKLKLTERSKGKHLALERNVLTTADQIIVTSPTTKEEFTEITDKPITVITNGFDTVIHKKIPKDRKFTIAHIGSLLTGRNPEILWQCLSELIEENERFKKDFELKLIGTISKDVLSSIEAYQLSKHVTNLGYVSHEAALKHQRSSQLLLLIEINASYTKCIIPGKIFEYIQSETPIIGIGPQGADFFKILKETNTGKAFEYSDKLALKNALIAYYEDYLQGIVKVNPIGLNKYTRKSLTQDLTALLKS